MGSQDGPRSLHFWRKGQRCFWWLSCRHRSIEVAVRGRAGHGGRVWESFIGVRAANWALGRQESPQTVGLRPRMVGRVVPGPTGSRKSPNCVQE